MVHYSVMVTIQIAMIYAMYVNLMEEGYGYFNYDLHVSPFYSVVLAKFVSSACLHLMLYPELANCLKLMKFIGNHRD